MNNKIYIRQVIVLLLTVMITACAHTSLMDSWIIEDNQRSYNHPMIIGISDSQQTRQLYEKQFVAKLKHKNISATPSYKLISSKHKIIRETVVKAIQGTDIEIDSVLVTYLVSSDSKMKYHDSPINAGYSGSADNNQISATIVSTRGQSRSEEVFVLKTDLYDVQSRALVWSAQTKSVGPESVDQVIEEVTTLLVDEMFNNKLFK